MNTHYAEIDGVATVGSLGKLPFAPELVVITAPAAAIPGLIEEAGARGAAGALIITLGAWPWPGLAGGGQRSTPRTNMACG